MRKLYIALLLVAAFFSQTHIARAESQAACAIWLCLPGGFPTGCADAYSEFKHRIKKGKSPLPNLSSCTVGPDGTSSNGSYKMGVEYFLSCRDGFQYDRTPQNNLNEVMCIPTNPKCNIREKYRGGEKVDCTPYQAERRKQTRFVQMWIDGKYLGQFFYQ